MFYYLSYSLSLSVSLTTLLSFLLSYYLSRLASGEVFTWGWGGYGILGHGDRHEQLKPRVVEALQPYRVTKVNCGGDHTIALVGMYALIRCLSVSLCLCVYVCLCLCMCMHVSLCLSHFRCNYKEEEERANI